MSQQQRIAVHFAPGFLARIHAADTGGWAKAMRGWFHDGDPFRNFGSNASNSKGSDDTWAWHLHMSPTPTATNAKAVLKWENQPRSNLRTSDRLVVYSLSRDDPLRHGLLLLALLGDPGGHAKLIDGPSAAERRELWEDIAYAHQEGGGAMPEGTFTEP